MTYYFYFTPRDVLLTDARAFVCKISLAARDAPEATNADQAAAKVVIMHERSGEEVENKNDDNGRQMRRYFISSGI